MEVLGVRVDNLTRAEILAQARNFLNEKKFHQIATINPEFIVTAQKDAKLKKILNNCDLNVADGTGINFAFWRRGERLKFRLPGADLMDEILKLAEEKNLKIFLAANKNGLSTWEETRDAILNKYPKLIISGANLSCHSRLDRESSEEIANPKLDSFVRGNDILFCNFGAPDQEKFLNSLKSAGNDNIRLAMGVGGSFDYLTGKISRVPVWMRNLGLEWLGRLIKQPGRAKRILNAVIVFPIKIIFIK